MIRSQVTTSGCELGDALERLLAVARRADDFEERAARQQLRHHFPDIRRIVDDENAEDAVDGHQLGLLNV